MIFVDNKRLINGMLQAQQTAQCCFYFTSD